MPDNAGVTNALSRQLLYEQVADSVRRMIDEHDLWGGYLPAERGLAKMFGVSQMTVRRGLAVLVKEKILTRRQGQGTRVAARPERRITSVLVGARWSDMSRGYIGQIVAGLSLAAGETDWNVVFRNLAQPGGVEAMLAALRGRRAQGLVLLALTDRTLVSTLLDAWRGPAVLVDHDFPGLPVTSVMDDSRGGARLAVEHLLALGHRRIGYIDVSRPELNSWRREGYLDALRGAGVEPDESLIVRSVGNPEAGRAAGEKLLALPEPPTAALTFDDTRAWGLWQAAEARGLRVGRDFALVALGESSMTGGPQQLSAVRIDWRQLGRMAAQELERLMAGGERRDRPVLLPGELEVRESSGAARL